MPCSSWVPCPSKMKYQRFSPAPQDKLVKPVMKSLLLGYKERRKHNGTVGFFQPAKEREKVEAQFWVLSLRSQLFQSCFIWLKVELECKRISQTTRSSSTMRLGTIPGRARNLVGGFLTIHSCLEGTWHPQWMKRLGPETTWCSSAHRGQGGEAASVPRVGFLLCLLSGCFVKTLDCSDCEREFPSASHSPLLLLESSNMHTSLPFPDHKRTSTETSDTWSQQLEVAGDGDAFYCVLGTLTQ